MKVLLVAERQDLREKLDRHLNPLGLSLIQYWNPIKAMDNIDEIDPDIVLFSASDYPRHWKPFLTFLRNHRTRYTSVFILLRPANFPFEEASKAQHLGVNGLVDDSFENRHDVNRLRDLIVRYKEIRDLRRNKRFIPHPEDRIEFIFSQPRTLQLVTGRVEDVSATGLRFRPDRPEQVADLDPDTLIRHGSLRLGETIFNLSCRITRNEDSLSVVFQDIPADVSESIDWYLYDHPKRELGLIGTR